MSAFLANVTFESGYRNNRHIHHAAKGGGQILICPVGEGWYQEKGKEAVSLVSGTVIEQFLYIVFYIGYMFSFKCVKLKKQHLSVGI